MERETRDEADFYDLQKKFYYQPSLILNSQAYVKGGLKQLLPTF